MWKFTPLLKSRIWGGDRIAAYKGIADDRTDIGESWELSGVAGDESVVAEGADAGLKLSELVAREGDRLLGKSVYERFGNEFPLLIKFIDARQDLSIQVHPNDALAWERHRSKGKTEMWYVIDAAPGAHLLSGFREPLTPDEYEASVADHTIAERMARYEVRPGDLFFLPAGRVHAIGAGSFVAEIQQTSDITYRIYDYDRKGADGKPRELHTEQAKAAIDYTVLPDYRTHYERRINTPVELVSSPYFTTDLLELTESVTLDLSGRDSFTVVICTAGSLQLTDHQGETASLRAGETLLIPASAQSLLLTPQGSATLLTGKC